jgi:hypothetical protein
MSMNNQPSLTLQVQHDDALVDVPSHPYHTRYFDVVTISKEESTNEPRKTSIYQNFESIMSYEDAIINAIIQLRDIHIGSSITSIQKHMKEHFIQENFPNLKNNIHMEDASFNYYLKKSLFIVALKSLLDKKVITSSPDASLMKNGCLSNCYLKLSRTYIMKRLEVFKQRIDLIERREERRKRELKLKLKMQEWKQVPVRIKPPLSKIRLVDQNAGIIIEKDKRVTKDKGGMDWDEERKKRSALLMRLGIHRNKLFVAKRTSLHEKMTIPHNRIMVQGL